jgi:type I restriction enzyme R subunit
LIVDELTKNGVMNEERLYQSPFIDIAPTGPEPLFKNKITKLFDTIKDVKLRAVA